MSHGLEQQPLTLLAEVFSRHPAVQRVALFGSRAKGSARHNSDIDLAIWGNLKRSELLLLQQELEQLPLPWNIDLLLYEQINDAPLREHIDRLAVTLFQRQNNALRQIAAPDQGQS